MITVEKTIRASHNYRSKKSGDIVDDPAASAVARLAELSAERSKLLYSKMFEEAKPILLGSLGLGAAARGVKGLVNVVRRNVSEPTEVPEESNVVDMPVPFRNKGAEYWKDLFSGAKAETVKDLPLDLPVKILGSIGAGTAGYKGVDYIMDRLRRSDQASELEDAKKDYEKALGLGVKTAEDGTLASDLDRLADRFEKSGVSVGQILGLYLTVAGGLGAGGLYAGYTSGNANSKRKLLQDATDQKLREQPTQPVFIRSQPQPQKRQQVTL